MTIKDIFGFRVPTPWALKVAVECDNPDLVLGVELEVENCDHSAEWYTERTGKLGWATTVDHSLRGNNVTTNGNQGVVGSAFEFISKPMKSSTLLYSMDEFFKVTKFDDKNYTDRCSVHVHANCTDLTADQVSSVALVYSVVEAILFRFVGADRDNNIYCMPWAHCRMNHDMVDKITSNVDGLARRWQKYTALNLIPLRTQGTVEFRQMHGTADMKKITTWINLIGCIFKYGTNTELTELIKEIKSLNSTSEYEVFFGKVLGRNLPYTEAYRVDLERGVISAKYGLINWKKAKKVARDDTTAPTPYGADLPDMDEEDEDEDRPQVRFAPPPVRAARPVEANRFAPWPRTGTEFDIGDLNELERRYVTRTLPGLWETHNGNLRITGQPDPNRGFATVELTLGHEEAPVRTPRMPRTPAPRTQRGQFTEAVWPAAQPVAPAQPVQMDVDFQQRLTTREHEAIAAMQARIRARQNNQEGQF